MAEIRCPNCGRHNPDILDVCQFCQAPLKPDSVLRIGEKPTKKNTGELEPVLPDWLKEVRQQARDAAEEEAAQAASQPKPKDDPLDFLAGLASQSGEEEGVPDWLASINPPPQEKPAASAPTPESDLAHQFDQEKPSADEEAELPWEREAAEAPARPEHDELSAWFAQASGKSDEIVEPGFQPEQSDRGWAKSFDSPLFTSKEPPAPREEEDLSWLRDLEEKSKQTGDLQAPRLNTGWTADSPTPSASSQPASQEDLSWLNTLGGMDAPAEQGGSGGQDLRWLDQLGGVESPQPFDAAPDRPVAPEPFASADELNLLRRLREKSGSGETPGAFVPEAIPEPASQEDLSWLNELGTPTPSSEPEAASAPAEDLSWLNDLGAMAESATEGQREESGVPPSLEPLAGAEGEREPEPDWLKSATEAPSMPAPGDVSMDWFARREQPAEERATPSEREAQPAPFADFLPPQEQPPGLSNQDVDSLFSEEMPDWLSRPEPEPGEAAPPQPVLPPAEGEGSLAPVELPSWVQAMRPVEAVIPESTVASPGEEEPEEKQGPLAGLRGVIPGAVVGASVRPKPISLKLQATDEQMTSAALLEQILATETTPRTLVSSSLIASQYILRWTLAALLLLVLGVVIGLRSQRIPVSTSLPAEASALSSAVTGIPAGSNVLVVIDYEPSLAGEMEAIGIPVLNQLVSRSQPNLAILSTTPNGPALAERLLASAGINTFAQYQNLGFLPGGSAGVLGFMEGPQNVIPAAQTTSFSGYAAVLVMTDHAESGRVWVEQLQNRKQVDPLLASQPLLMVASAQAGPLLQPYVDSRQVTGMLSGLAEAARYEAANSNSPGLARSYWDAFGAGLALSIVMMVVGSLWSLWTALRARRLEANQG